MKNIILFIAIAFSFISCTTTEERKTEVLQKRNDPESSYEMMLLFKSDNCSIYRFYDEGHYVYWTNCEGKIEQEYTVQSGKNSRRTVHVQNQTTKP